MQIHLSPLQGFTEFRFRNAHQKYFGGVDRYYAPYIRLQADGLMKNSCQRDVAPDNNGMLPVIPQVMCNTAEDFLYVADYVQSLGYEEINWNLGCPYPMVTKRHLGSGLIEDADRIHRILDAVFQNSNIRISVKMRLGYKDAKESFALMPVLNAFPLQCVIVHPRLGIQLYKGPVDLGAFEKLMGLSKHPFHYNGNIDSVATFLQLQNRFSAVEGWWLGRGVVANPFLPGQIKEKKATFPADWRIVFSAFHDDLLLSYTSHLSGEKHVLMKMYGYWEYFHQLFGDSKALKKIRKAKRLSEYSAHVKQLLEQADLPID